MSSQFILKEWIEAFLKQTNERKTSSKVRKAFQVKFSFIWGNYFIIGCNYNLFCQQTNCLTMKSTYSCVSQCRQYHLQKVFWKLVVIHWSRYLSNNWKIYCHGVRGSSKNVGYFVKSRKFYTKEMYSTAHQNFKCPVRTPFRTTE